MTTASGAFTFLLTLIAWQTTAQSKPYKAVILENKPWTEARRLLTDTTIVVIPLGAQSKEHGPHLQLRNDFLIAEYLKDQIARIQPVVIYPTINYHYYPSFLEYAGSTSVQLETAYSLIVDICRVISAHGPKKFYILNTGVSTLLPLRIAQEMLARQGIQMTYTDILHVAGEVEKNIRQQPMGTHADEIETSMMLYIAPNTVNMSEAARDIPAQDVPGPLSLDPKSPRYSPTGIFGDATLATRQKGRIVVDAMVLGINLEINALRKASPIEPSKDTPELSKLTGEYNISPTEKVTISMDQGYLMFEGKGPRKLPLVLQSQNAFSVGTRGRAVFFADETGSYSTLYLNWEGKDFLGKK